MAVRPAAEPASRAAIDELALNLVWADRRIELCALYLDTLATGMSKSAVDQIAADAVFGPQGVTRTPGLEAQLLRLLHGC